MVTYLKCAFCGMSKPLYSNKYPGGVLTLKDFTVDPSKYPLIQIREALPGPGRGNKEKGVGGFKTVGEISISDMLEDPAYRALGLKIKDRLINIVKSYIEAGIISREELL